MFRGYSLPGNKLVYPDWHKALSQTWHWCHSLSLRMKSLRRTTIHTIRKDCGKAKGRRIRDSSMHRELHKLLGGRENRKIFTVMQPRIKDMGTDPSGRFLEKENVVWHIVSDPWPFKASPNGSLVKSFLLTTSLWSVFSLGDWKKKSVLPQGEARSYQWEGVNTVSFPENQRYILCGQKMNSLCCD